MAIAAPSPFASSRRRLIKDRLARVGVSAGGLMVLAALLLIFGYLLYVVVPIFKPVSMDAQASTSMAKVIRNLPGSDASSRVPPCKDRAFSGSSLSHPR